MATGPRTATPAAPRSDRPRRRWKVEIGVVACLAGSFFAPMVAAAPPAAAADVVAALVRTLPLSGLSPPSPDPSGIAWDPAANRLIVSDSEVEEMAIFDDANLFELDLGGNLTGTGDITLPAPGVSNEPTGLSFDPVSGHLFVSDDQQKKILRLAPGIDGDFGTPGGVLVSSVNTNDFGNTDPEDVAYDTSSGDLFTADGSGREIYRISPGSNGVFDGVPPIGDDTTSHFDTAVFGAQGTEGLAYDPVRDTLLVVDPGTKKIFETTKAGSLLNTISLASADPRHAEDVVVAPAFANPGLTNMYVVARGVDNDSNPNENDGKLYEVSVSLPPVGNQPPNVHAGSDQTVTLPDSAALGGAVSDDGLPEGATLTSTWTQVSGAGTATFTDVSSPTTTVSFSAPGTYALRLTADDTDLQSADDVVIAVQAEGTATLDVSIATGNDDAEEKASGAVNRASTALDLGTLDAGGQTVGLRFTDVSVPQGATITAAHVQFQAKKSITPVTLLIAAEASNDAGIFTTQAFGISNRPRTSADVTWTPEPWTTANELGPKQKTPDLTTVIQEVVDLNQWSGNALVLFVTRVSGTGKRAAVSFNGSGAEPRLHVEYTAS
ncbi:MAG: PKD domain-containing protein [Actinomycetota bacterium]